jgi:hypothetical protein
MPGKNIVDIDAFLFNLTQKEQVKGGENVGIYCGS